MFWTLSFNWSVRKSFKYFIPQSSLSLCLFFSHRVIICIAAVLLSSPSDRPHSNLTIPAKSRIFDRSRDTKCIAKCCRTAVVFVGFWVKIVLKLKFNAFCPTWNAPRTSRKILSGFLKGRTTINTIFSTDKRAGLDGNFPVFSSCNPFHPSQFSLF